MLILNLAICMSNEKRHGEVDLDFLFMVTDF